MRERTIQAQADAKKEFDEYVRSTAGGTSTADELGKLADLKAKGVLSEEEYQAQKAKLIG